MFNAKHASSIQECNQKLAVLRPKAFPGKQFSSKQRNEKSLSSRIYCNFSDCKFQQHYRQPYKSCSWKNTQTENRWPLKLPWEGQILLGVRSGWLICILLFVSFPYEIHSNVFCNQACQSVWESGCWSMYTCIQMYLAVVSHLTSLIFNWCLILWVPCF